MTEESPHKSNPGLERVGRALAYSLQGLRAAYRNESAFRQEIFLALVLIPVACVLPVALTQKALLISCVLIVLVIELVNSAVEATVDRISLDHHEFSKRAKDVGSAAVLLSLINCLLVWVLVLIEVFG